MFLLEEFRLQSKAHNIYGPVVAQSALVIALTGSDWNGVIESFLRIIDLSDILEVHLTSPRFGFMITLATGYFLFIL